MASLPLTFRPSSPCDSSLRDPLGCARIDRDFHCDCETASRAGHSVDDLCHDRRGFFLATVTSVSHTKSTSDEQSVAVACAHLIHSCAIRRSSEGGGEGNYRDLLFCRDS
eukprot:760852-Hanusia_phi.AAC.4